MAPYDPDSIPPQDWGFSSSAQFTTTLHNGPSPSTDPSKVRLPSNQTICILGASRGIGAGIALSYAKAGAGTLILASRRVSGLEETRDRCKKVNPDVEVLIVPCDVTSADSVSDLAKKVEEKYGRLDVVVVNSGLVGAAVTDLTTDDPAEISGTMDVNYTGTYYAAKYFTSLLLKSENGAKAFIAINSLAALLIRGPIANSKYAISKLAQVRLMEHLHEQKGGEGLNAFALHPGAVQTEM